MAGFVRQRLSDRGVPIPDYWDIHQDGSRQKFTDALRSVVIELARGGNGVDDSLLGQIHGLMQDERQRFIENTTLRLVDLLIGFGVLEPLLADPAVEEIFVRNGVVAIERNGAMVHLGELAPDEYFYRLTHLTANMAEIEITPENRAVLCDLPGGERFTAVLPPLSRNGTAINIRSFGGRDFALGEIDRIGTFDHHPSANASHLGGLPESVLDKIKSLNSQPARFLAWVAASLGGSMLIAGEFSGGKTTLLNALSAYLPKDSAVAVLETFEELKLQHPFLAHVVAPSRTDRSAKGQTLGWVLNTFYTRMNPSCIALGEIVDAAEALEYIRAANLGRRAFTTIHGDSIKAALARLESLALEGQKELGRDAVRQMIALGIDVVVLLKHAHEDDRVLVQASRYLQEIALLKETDGNGEYVLETLYRVDDVRRGVLSGAWGELA